MKFIIYQDRSGKWRWRLRARNGNIVADSGQGYATKHNAKRAAEATVLGIAQLLFGKNVIDRLFISPNGKHATLCRKY